MWTREREGGKEKGGKEERKKGGKEGRRVGGKEGGKYFDAKLLS